MTTRYIITADELEEIIQSAMDVVRSAHGNGDMKRAETKLMKLEDLVEAREVPEQATHFAVIKMCSFSSYQEIPK